MCAHVRDVASVVSCYSRRGLHAGVRGVVWRWRVQSYFHDPKFPLNSVNVSPGFEWVNPVLSSFEDWVLGWVIQTGLLLLSSF